MAEVVLSNETGPDFDTFTIGGDYDLVYEFPPEEEGDEPISNPNAGKPDSRLGVDAEIAINRLENIEAMVYTISGMTIVRGGGGYDDIRVLQTQILDQVASPVITISEITPGVRGDTEEVVHLTIGAEVGYFVLEFADQNLDDTDPSGDDTVPGAEQTVVLPYNVTANELWSALEALRLVGGDGFINDVAKFGDHFEIKFSTIHRIVLKNILYQLPNLSINETISPIFSSLSFSHPS